MSELTLSHWQEIVQDALGETALSVDTHNGAVIAVVDPEDIRHAMITLRDGDNTKLDILSHMTAVDYSPRDPRFEVVYELYSLEFKQRVRVKCPLPFSGGEYDLPEIDSIHDIYLTANWHERECYDLMGIRFAGHPDLRRIMLTESWDGHPLRKEYPFDGKRVWKVGSTVSDGVSMEGDLGL